MELFGLRVVMAVSLLWPILYLATISRAEMVIRSVDNFDPVSKIISSQSSSSAAAAGAPSSSSSSSSASGAPANPGSSSGDVSSGHLPVRSDPPIPGNGRCEAITVPMCREIGYNLTAMPNELNHDTQEEAGLEVHQFWPLVEIKCSADLKFFLCSMYTPICLPEYAKPLPACRSVCERARAGCAPIMQQYGFSWPERMACERLPNQGDTENLCMEQDNHTKTPTSNINMISNVPTSTSSPRPTRPQKTTHISKCKLGKNQKHCANTVGESGRDCTCTCRAPLISLAPGPMDLMTSELMSIKSSSIAGVADCALPCHGAFLTPEEQGFATVWLTLWSGICAASTLTTVITFLIDTQRFKYPERPIVFLSACYFLVSVGYLARSILGHEEIACNGPVLRSGTKGPNTCVTVFLLIYFFGMASSVWWVILAFTWFLAAGLKWGNEAIASYSQFFHLAAWLAPTAQTVWALIAGGVAGDPIAGVCTVAPDAVRNFILTPLLVYLLLGTTFLLAGFVSLFRIRSVIKRQPGAKADKLEKLMIRIGIFSVLYTVPASAVLACYLYESTLRDKWLRSLTCPCRPRERPLYSVLMLKYFMALAVGITSGVWIWSGKTLDSWRRLSSRIFGSGLGGADRNITGVAGLGHGSSMGVKGIVNRSTGLPYPSLSGAGSTLLPPGSVASASQHHIHHHLLKQPPLSHV